MIDDGILKAQGAIEKRLQQEGAPIDIRMLLKAIRDKGENVRDIDLREAIWIMIGNGRISMTPKRELELRGEGEPNLLVK